MVWVGTVTMLVGVLYAMVQTDLKRLLAFSTVSQIGYMITGIGLGTPLASPLDYCTVSTMDFLKEVCSWLPGRCSTQPARGTWISSADLPPKMPRTTSAWMISVGSMMGIPLMSGFASKWMVYTAALQSGMDHSGAGRMDRQYRYGLLLYPGHRLRVSRFSDRGQRTRS